MSSGVLSFAELAATRRPASEIGGKAANLARLIAAELPVPDGFVVLPGAGVDGVLEQRGAALGARLAVRSSSPVEDALGGAAPGLFFSATDIDPADLARAITEVRASARSPAVARYAAATGRVVPPELPVIVQRWVAAEHRGTLYTRSPDDPMQHAIELAGHPGALFVSRDRGPAPRWAALASDAIAELVRFGTAAEIAIDAAARGADVEWLISAGNVWLVQARPLPGARRRPRERPRADAFAFAAADPTIVWRRDIEHNPLPLSPAQRGLVDLVRDAGAPLALARGYLYERRPAGASDDHDEVAGGIAELADRLESLFFAQVWPALDATLVELEERSPDLESALAAFKSIYFDYSGELARTLRTARRAAAATPARLHRLVGAGLLEAITQSQSFSPTTRRSTERRARAGPAAFWSPFASAWDVAAPTFGETPAELETVVDQLESRPRPSAGASLPQATALTRQRLADVVHAVAELDDRIFFRAQRLVRRALLGLAARVGLRANDVFLFDLDDLRRSSKLGRQPDDAPAALRAALESLQRDRALKMPVQVHGDEMVWDRIGPEYPALRGVGSGGQCRGRASLAAGAAVPTGSILIAVSIAPGDVLRAAEVAGIAVEHGSLLGHAAAMARELAIPIVTQVAGLTRNVKAGDLLWLDGDSGLVVRLGQ